eukprot:scaffold262165_cov22-Tisochrysis_lutea.AAC.1
MQAFMYDKPEYRTMLSSLRTIVQEKGVLGLWSGILPRMTRIICATFILNYIRTNIVDTFELHEECGITSCIYLARYEQEARCKQAGLALHDDQRWHCRQAVRAMVLCIGKSSESHKNVCKERLLYKLEQSASALVKGVG